VAVNRPGIMDRQLYLPVLETFLRGLPHAFRTADARPGTTVRIDISGQAAGSWFLQRDDRHWQLVAGADNPEATLVMHEDLAWRVFTKAVSPQEAAIEVSTAGDRALASKVLSLVAVLA
jgi:hypothetical protein